MSTDELERLLAASLHESDSRPVDVTGRPGPARDRARAGPSELGGGGRSSGSLPPSSPSS